MNIKETQICNNDDDAVEQTYKLWENTLKKLFLSGAATVAPMILVGVPLLIYLFTHDDITDIDHLMSDFFNVSPLVPLLFLGLETAWVLWGIITINKLNRTDLHILDMVRPYKAPANNNRRKQKSYRRVLLEILPAISVWNYMFLFIWLIGTIYGESF
ncbi:hypothetical protein [Paenibacillus apis]|uniref:Uncharacterized protein n=1 Tax=Paenibacillus apis TaxID=1792174 RepID=A0A920CMJ9_9BACL|nr:hypothetical protein [Paenibacillus apis]GIO42162.1 hypothetical protein J41TS4_19200 [Paenibacillus apis]